MLHPLAPDPQGLGCLFIESFGSQSNGRRALFAQVLGIVPGWLWTECLRALKGGAWGTAPMHVDCVQCMGVTWLCWGAVARGQGL